MSNAALGRPAAFAVVWFASSVGAAGCLELKGFACSEDAQCGPSGRCSASGRCTFPADECPSGRRYGEHSGDVSGECEPAGTASSTGTTAADQTGTDTSVSATCVPGGRVAAGIAAVYGFCQGAGTVIPDESGVEPPLDLRTAGSGFAWEASPPGLRVPGGEAVVQSTGAASKVFEACTESGEVAVEAWVTSAAPDQVGPARIVVVAEGTKSNVMVGQGLTPDSADLGWSARLRTSETPVGATPTIGVPGPAATTMTHLLFTRESNGAEQLYVDAEVAVTGDRTGDFSTWAADAPLVVGNATSRDRPWEGTIHLAAIYCRALSPQQVQQNFAAGVEPGE